MVKQRTPLQELISTSESIRNLDPKVQLMILRGEMQRLLPVEQKHIVEACYEGMHAAGFDPNRGRAELYFKTNYGYEDPSPQ